MWGLKNNVGSLNFHGKSIATFFFTNYRTRPANCPGRLDWDVVKLGGGRLHDQHLCNRPGVMYFKKIAIIFMKYTLLLEAMCVETV